PKIYFRDSGLLHNLLSLHDAFSIAGHPKVGASWEGFALEQFLQTVQPSQAYFWATHSGAEIDLVYLHQGRRFGVGVKYHEAPSITKSMRIALDNLHLDKMWIIYPGKHVYPVDKRILVCPLDHITNSIF
ncbi:MAG: DUF4143 domain-containing protein, partial [Deltaproteobacteria bacterium]|nr:DUF4143 domain-containing protein [Deltaproteobacteria bacterium]